MNICYLDTRTIHNILYVARPTISEEIYKKFVAEFRAVPGSEYDRLVHRIANLLLFCGEDLSKLHCDYFSMEYESFADFLEAELGLDEELVEKILEMIKDDESLWRIDVANFETYNFMKLFEGEIWEEEPIVTKINIAMMRCENEN